MPKKKVSGTREWAASNVNVMTGCPHRCRYCYACSMAVRFGRVTTEGWGVETPCMDKVHKGYGKRKGTIMFPTTHDLTPGNMGYTLPVLRKLLDAGNKVLVVSKPHTEVLGTFINYFAKPSDTSQLLFRFTIGSADNKVLSFWEPGAPDFLERYTCLVTAHTEGFETSVSMEPLLEVEEDLTVTLVKSLAPFVTDSIWIGKMNRPQERLERNGHWDDPLVKEMTKKLLESQTDDRIRFLYGRLKDHPKVKWKESIKDVVGLEIPVERGLDI